MHALLARYFLGVSRHGFDTDLAEKEWAILLRDRASSSIEGFSTLMRLRVAIEGMPIVAFFSGDTIVARERWNEAVLPRLWGRHVLRLAAAETTPHVYWFLISSGYRTYRFLPVFFRHFYPTYASPTPPETKRVLDVLARAKFGAGYDAHSGVVRLERPTPLRSGTGEPAPARLRDPHVAFFLKANPDYARGDELACIAPLSPVNLTRAARRTLAEGDGRR